MSSTVSYEFFVPEAPVVTMSCSDNGTELLFSSTKHSQITDSGYKIMIKPSEDENWTTSNYKSCSDENMFLINKTLSNGTEYSVKFAIGAGDVNNISSIESEYTEVFTLTPKWKIPDVGEVTFVRDNDNKVTVNIAPPDNKELWQTAIKLTNEDDATQTFYPSTWAYPETGTLEAGWLGLSYGEKYKVELYTEPKEGVSAQTTKSESVIKYFVLSPVPNVKTGSVDEGIGFKLTWDNQNKYVKCRVYEDSLYPTPVTYPEATNFCGSHTGISTGAGDSYTYIVEYYSNSSADEYTLLSPMSTHVTVTAKEGIKAPAVTVSRVNENRVKINYDTVTFNAAKWSLISKVNGDNLAISDEGNNERYAIVNVGVNEEIEVSAMFDSLSESTCYDSTTTTVKIMNVGDPTASIEQTPDGKGAVLKASNIGKGCSINISKAGEKDVIEKISSITGDAEKTFTGLTPGETYTYDVWVEPPEGYIGLRSNAVTVSVTPLIPIDMPDLTAKHTGVSGGGYATWDAVEGAAGYEVTICGLKVNKTFTVNSTFAAFDGLIDGEIYTVLVRAVPDKGYKAGSSATAYFVPCAALSAPKNMTVKKGETNGEYIVSFDLVKGAKGYIVSVYERSTGKWTDYKADKSPVTVAGITGVGDYEIMVKSTGNGKDVGDSDYSESSIITIAEPDPIIVSPVTLISLTATGVKNTLVAEWTENPEAYGYVVYYTETGNTEWKQLVKTTATKVTCWGAVDGTEYAVKVVAYALRDGIAYYSVDSNILTGTPYTKLPAPTGLKVTATGVSGELKVTWDKSDITDKYEISCNQKRYYPTGNEYVITGLTDGEYVTIRVKAIAPDNRYGDSDFCDYVRGAPIAEDRVLPAPTNIKAKGTGKKGVLLVTFQPVEHALGYVVSYGKKTVKTMEASIEITDLTDGKNYKVKVKALGDNRNYKDSPYSAIVSGTSFKRLSTPKNVSATSNGATSIKVSFTGVKNATHYTVTFTDPDGKSKTQNKRISNMAGKTVTVVLKDLEKNTKYTVTVTAKSTSTAFGKSNPSEPNKAKTK